MPASSAAAALWRAPLENAATLERWEHLRASHSDLQRRVGVASGDPAKLARLAALDAFVTGALPAALAPPPPSPSPGAETAATAPQRAQPQPARPAPRARTPSPSLLTRDDLVKMVEWKLLRGKWRPGLLGYAQAQTDAAVGAAAAAALSALLRGGGGGAPASAPPPTPAQTRAALDALCALRGVGPATASIVLCAATAGRLPYMGDEALEAAVGGRRYTADEYWALAAALQHKAAELRSTGRAAADGGRAWTAEDVQRALHAAELEARLGAGGGGGGKAAAAASGAKQGGGGGGNKNKAKAAAEQAPPANKRQRRR